MVFSNSWNIVGRNATCLKVKKTNRLLILSLYSVILISRKDANGCSQNDVERLPNLIG
jgi:hypothetical protein